MGDVPIFIDLMPVMDIPSDPIAYTCTTQSGDLEPTNIP